MDPRDRKALEEAGFPLDSSSSGSPPEPVKTLVASRNQTTDVDQHRAQLAIRIETCKTCPELNRLGMCRQCGCFMPAKTRIKSASCPIGKWHPIIPLKFLEPDDS